MSPTLGNKLNFDGMSEYGDNIILGTAPETNYMDSQQKKTSSPSFHQLLHSRQLSTNLYVGIPQIGQIS